jgi:probable F420-dependent oxidoreductase
MAGGAYDIPIPDPLIWMTWVASATTRLKVATGILIVPQRNPVVTAKAIASLDHLSGGRVLLGVGVGWLREEFDAIGANFDERAAIYDEHLEAMRALWASDKASYEGRYVSFRDVYCLPRPPAGSVPIIIGGHSKAAARRAGRMGNGFFPARGVPDDLLAVVRSSAEAAGRDPDRIEVTTSMPEDLDQLPELARAGVDRILVPVTPMAGLATVIASPDDCARWAPIIDNYR